MTLSRLESRLRRRVAHDPLLRELRAAALSSAAGLWLVGGYVRDAALAKRSTEIDLIGTAGVRRLVATLSARWGTRGFRFRKRGVTTWRFASGERRIDLVDATRRGLREDLRRRELTINAIAFDLREYRLEDPLHGLADLRSGRLELPRRGVLREDAVRALRIARFLAQLPAFRLGPRARREAAVCGAGLRRAAAERVRQELDKLLEAPAPERGLTALDELALIDALLPELAGLRGCTAGADRPDAWRHTLDAVAVSATRRGIPGAPTVRRSGAIRLLRWALLLHDISKPETLAFAVDGRPTFHGHEMLGARRADGVLRRLRLPSAERRRVGRLIRFHLRPAQLADAGAPPRGLRRLVREAGNDLPLLIAHAACDALASGGPRARQRWTALRPVLNRLLELHRDAGVKRKERLLDGRDVMRILDLAPGPEVGAVLARVAELQTEGRLRDRSDGLRFLRRIAKRGKRAGD